MTRRDRSARPVLSLVSALVTLSWTCALPDAATAESRSVVRVTSAEHPGGGRVEIDAPDQTWSISRDAGHVVIRFSGDPIIAALPRTPRNVLAIRAVTGGLELTVPPGADVNARREGSKAVVDIVDSARDPQVPATTPRGRTPAEARTATSSLAAKRTANGAMPTPAPVSPARASRDGPVRESAPAAGSHADTPSPAAATPPTPLPAGSARSVTPAEQPPVKPTVMVPDAAMTQPPGERADRSSPAAVAPSRPPPIGGSATSAALPEKPIVVTPEAAATQPPGERTEPASPASVQISLPPPRAPVVSAAPTMIAPAATDADAHDEDRPPVSTEPMPAWQASHDAGPSGPVAIAAIRTRAPGGVTGTAMQVPFVKPVGAALFSRGQASFVVFDERRPIDLAALRDDPVFHSATVSLFPAATVIHFSRPAGQSAMLSPAQAGWRVSVVSAAPRPAALTPVIDGQDVTFTVDAVGQVVAIADPQTGGTLLVGTQRDAGQAVLVGRKTADFILPVTAQGIVLEPLSDSIGLRTTPQGFVVSGARGPLALSPVQPMNEALLAAARLTRLFTFPRQTTEDLTTRERRLFLAVAGLPLLKRGPARRALAETMICLGLGVEARNLLLLTMKDDPKEAATPATIGLAAVAALLAGQPEQAGDLADPALTGTDEIALWRALQMAMTDERSQAAAEVLAGTTPLIFTYPAEMRRRILPLAMETMVLGGQIDAAAALLAQKADDPALAYARALLAEAKGDIDGALKQFDALTDSRSALDHARAAIRAIELRLARGQLDNKAAADALEERLFAWRGDWRDLALRLRIAELRQKSGAWRQVFALLRGAKADFPARAEEIDRRMRDVFAAVPRDPALDSMPPLELIALLEENSELLDDGPDGEPMRARLADRLMALDLPKQADPLLTRLMRAAPYGPVRAEFGATLSTLRLHEGDLDGAILALSESNSADISDAVRERRALIIARVEAKRGETRSAIEALSDDRTRDADDERAWVLEQAQDWLGARDALTVLADRIPPEGPLDDAQRRIALRLATAAARANDDATLASARGRLISRIGSGPEADLFRLLTAEPVRGTADLARTRAEIGLTGALTADIDAKKAAAKTP
jgi:hypothetical protein